MDAFTHLSVLISIVLGLGVTSLLGGLARIVQVRGKVRLYWPVLIWIAVLLTINVQVWWATFELRAIATWTFQVYALNLLQPVLLYFVGALVIPDFDRDDSFDLRENYFSNASWFFSIFGALLVVSLIRSSATFGQLPGLTDTLFHILFLLVAAACAIFKAEPLHKAGAVFAAVGVAAYIGLLFLVLR